MIKYVLFDLDGTLLPMDNDLFTKYYFKLLCKKLAFLGYKPGDLINAVWGGMHAMVKNDGSVINGKVFWKAFCSILGEKAIEAKETVDDFYTNEFNEAKCVCGYNQELVDFVKSLKQNGYHIILATNPIFPTPATHSRIKWAGFDPSDFELITTYDNIGLCKPNTLYYKEILNRVGAKPEDCIMVGNDVQEDMVAKEIGMDVFLLTDHIINRTDEDISKYPHGNTQDLINYIK